MTLFKRASQWSLLGVSLALLSGCDSDGSASNRTVAPTFSVGGTVSGLAPGETLTLLDNNAASLSLSASGAFTFPVALPANAGYAVTASAAPAGQTCTVAAGSGTVTTANVANVVVTCSDQAFALGGTIHGLNSAGLILANGINATTAQAGATSFKLPTALAYTSSYSVVVKTQPARLACAVSAGSGAMPAHAVTNVAVTCTDQPFTLGGTVSGLGANTGLVLANGINTVVVPAGATSFTLPARVSFGSAYSVSVHDAPPGLTCTVSSGSGNMPANNVKNVAVVCSDQSYSLGGPVSGLTGAGLVLANGGDTFTVPSGATSFIMPTPVAYTSPYAVTIRTQPAGLLCSTSNASGTMGTSPISDIAISCAILRTVGGTINGLGAGTGLVLANGNDTLAIMANATRFTLPNAVAQGANYNVTVMAHPTLVSCTVTNGSNTMGAADVTNIAINCGSGSESVLHSFAGPPSDGANPNAGADLLQASDGNLYGLTAYGGLYGEGTMVKITPTGTETVVYSFGNGVDGSYPIGRLVQGIDGSLYGVTQGGGTIGFGAIFKITPAGVETVLWSFGGSGDCQQPYGGLLLASDGNFYGATQRGAPNSFGCVYRVTPNGAETVLWTFTSNPDADSPRGNLIEATDGNFYGMTVSGGIYNGGTVFRVTPTGVVTVLWSFGAGTDGYAPNGSLIQASDGNFYGMTAGSKSNGGNGTGTIFKITLAGTETVLWDFGTGVDGAYPYGALVQASDGNFYGLTSQGGLDNGGTIFEFTAAGVKSVLWSFGAGVDGLFPSGGLVQANDGSFYGMTGQGGASGSGTIFVLD